MCYNVKLKNLAKLYIYIFKALNKPWPVQCLEHSIKVKGCRFNSWAKACTLVAGNVSLPPTPPSLSRYKKSMER